jgi:hypothetical protein
MARTNQDSSNFADCLTIGEAADFLGVSAATLRNWDRSGKLKPRRHPQNGYRIYLHEDLTSVLKSADLPLLNEGSIAPQIDWSKMGETEHFVQYYESDEFLLESVAGFAANALCGDDCCLLIMTLDHRCALERRLAAEGIDVPAAKGAGRLVVRNVADNLSEIIADRVPNAKRFYESISKIIAQLAGKQRRIYIFGELAPLLWAIGHREVAIAVERLWNELAKHYKFALFCAYPLSAFVSGERTGGFDRICDCHTRVIPAESYSTIEDEYGRMRAISRLQLQAQLLTFEIDRHREMALALEKRECEPSDFLQNAAEDSHSFGSKDFAAPIDADQPNDEVLADFALVELKRGNA